MGVSCPYVPTCYFVIITIAMTMNYGVRPVVSRLSLPPGQVRSEAIFVPTVPTPNLPREVRREAMEKHRGPALLCRASASAGPTYRYAKLCRSPIGCETAAIPSKPPLPLE